MDDLSLGPTPAEEKCEQLGPNYDPVRSKRECREFIAQLRRQFGEEPHGTRFAITSNPHDFGTYHDVVIKFDPESEEATAFAFRVEAEAPAEWDDQARASLELATAEG